MLGFVQFNNVSIFACKIIVTTLGQDNTYQTPTKNQRRLTRNFHNTEFSGP